MEIGLICASGGPEIVERYVQTAESAGYASIWAPEHVVFFEDYDPTYPYSEGGRPPMTTETGMLEPLNLLSFVAAKTTRVRLGTGVFLLPQRNPVYTAKETTTLDILSGGRLDLGIGVGWLREEMEAVDVPFEERGARCDEYIEILRRLWTNRIAEFSGRFYELAPCAQEPHPTQKPHPPILVGGTSKPAIRRAAQLGDGWVAINLTPGEAAEHMQRIRELREAAGLSMDGFRTTMMAVNFPIKPADLGPYSDAGIDQVVLPPMKDGTVIEGPEDLYALVEDIAESFVGAARAL
jgi:probable F420-dependent oxidoreductase